MPGWREALRWDALTHRSARLYHARQRLIMGPLRFLAGHICPAGRDGAQQHTRRMHDICQRILKGRLVVEVGCGPGNLSKDLIEEYDAAQYIGVDNSLGMVNDARKLNHGFAYVCGDAASLPLRSDSADVVMSAFLFHHIPIEARLGCIREMARVAKTEIIVTDVYGFPPSLVGWLYQNYSRIADGSRYRFTLAEWRDFFRQAGLTIIYEASAGEKPIIYRVAFWVVRQTQDR